MPERIYTSSTNGRFSALDETPFATEDELQALVAKHPEILDGEQIRPGDARRWILVTREKGIAESSGGSARWAVDHLLIDQDAVPTLVELKRSSNSEIRRTIVGQLLEYAAHASETWSAEELREAFESNASEQGRDAQDELAKLLRTDDDPDMDEFWQNVSTNLVAKRLRLLFVADEIPDPLARVVEFLNAQMPHIEVMAVEIRKFDGTSSQTLVPRVIGRTSGISKSGQRLSRDSFLEKFSDDQTRDLAGLLLDSAKQSGGEIHYGRNWGLSIRVKCSAWRRPVTVAWIYTEAGRGWQRTREFSFGANLFDSDIPEELRSLLDRWVAQFSNDSFAEDVSSKGVKAWSVSHRIAPLHKDLLVGRLRSIVSELAAL